MEVIWHRKKKNKHFCRVCCVQHFLWNKGMTLQKEHAPPEKPVHLLKAAGSEWCSWLGFVSMVTACLFEPGLLDMLTKGLKTMDTVYTSSKHTMGDQPSHMRANCLLAAARSALLRLNTVSMKTEDVCKLRHFWTNLGVAYWAQVVATNLVSILHLFTHTSDKTIFSATQNQPSG